jgi:hypothetical protein
VAGINRLFDEHHNMVWVTAWACVAGAGVRMVPNRGIRKLLEM